MVVELEVAVQLEMEKWHEVVGLELVYGITDGRAVVPMVQAVSEQ